MQRSNLQEHTRMHLRKRDQLAKLLESPLYGKQQAITKCNKKELRRQRQDRKKSQSLPYREEASKIR